MLLVEKKVYKKKRYVIAQILEEAHMIELFPTHRKSSKPLFIYTSYGDAISV